MPLAAGIGDLEDELYTLNNTGRSIWALLNGRNTIADVVAALEQEYDEQAEQVTADVIGLVEELLKRKILVEGTSV